MSATFIMFSNIIGDYEKEYMVLFFVTFSIFGVIEVGILPFGAFWTGAKMKIGYVSFFYVCMKIK